MKAGDDRIREIFVGWKVRNEYDREAAAKFAGFRSYSTMKRRLDDPETLTVKELRKLIEITRASDDDIVKMITGRRIKT